MLTTSYTLGRIWDIPLRLHVSLLIPVIWALGTSNTLLALLFIIGIAASVAAHELAHCFVALRTGCRVKEIKLTLIGGIASIYELPRRPRDEMIMAAAGPAVSILLGILLVSLSAPLARSSTNWAETFYNTRRVSVLVALTRDLGIFNLVIGVFNLIPAIPLDGGRIFRAALAHKQGYLRATFTAMRVGRIVAILLGITALRLGSFTLFLISLFVYFGAGREYAQARIRQLRDPSWFAGRGSANDSEVEVSPSPWQEKRQRKRIRIQRD